MSMLSVQEAQTLILGQIHPLSTEMMPIGEAAGFVLGQDIQAAVQLPGWDNSAMDGYAVRCADILGSGGSLPVSDHIAAGDGAERTLTPGTAARIFTGALMPRGADAVVLQEDTHRDGEKITVNERPHSGQHIRRAGEDIGLGQRVLAAGRVLTAGDLSCLASLGVSEVRVHRRPTVHLMTSGSELLRPGEGAPARGQIIDGNTTALSASVSALGLGVQAYPVVKDDEGSTRRAVQGALSADVLITTGGVSVGEHDHIRGAIKQACGDGFGFWKVAVKPGKPLVFGQAGDCSVFGLPGNPVSALVTFELFVRPALLKLAGHERCLRQIHSAYLTHPLPAGGRREEYLRARCWTEDGQLLVDTNRSQSSGALSSIAGADALVILRPGEAARASGDRVEVLRLDCDGPGVRQS